MREYFITLSIHPFDIGCNCVLKPRFGYWAGLNSGLTVHVIMGWGVLLPGERGCNFTPYSLLLSHLESIGYTCNYNIPLCKISPHLDNYLYNTKFSCKFPPHFGMASLCMSLGLDIWTPGWPKGWKLRHSVTITVVMPVPSQDKGWRRHWTSLLWRSVLQQHASG